MSEKEVTQLLGQPVYGGPVTEPAEKDTPVMWHYDSGDSLFSGLQLDLEFVESKLRHGAVRLRPFPTSLSDILDGKSKPLIYVGGLYEKPEFAQQLHCR